MLALGLIEALEDQIVIFVAFWLGGILLCATPYAWALVRAARDAARPAPTAEATARVRRPSPDPASPAPGHRGPGR